MTDEYGIGLAADKARQWTETRDGRILAAHKMGVSLRDIAALAGLTHSGVAKILKRLEENR